MSDLPVKYKPTKIKTKTQKGQKVSHFTLRVLFYPNEKYGKNPKFTYRGDITLKELNSLSKNKFKNEMEALIYKASHIKNNTREMLLFDNYFPSPYSLIKKWIDGEIKQDYTNEYFIGESGQLERKFYNP
jgi:hypothetical protein